MSLLKYQCIQSPVGILKIVVNDHALLAILWENEKLGRIRLDSMLEEHGNALILEAEKQLNDYFSRRRDAFNIPVETIGTPFQLKVWEALRKIPYGATCSYKDIALKIGHPKAVRAVGTAIGRNPISIMIPCHRVIASNGTLAGFAGGLDRKKMLLDIES
ncbi:MAG: methylated-DNA--[protein]-cysteine S-methyltransferase [Parachlamydiaceae bacterium]